jgi:hypothetical protein
LVLLQKSEGCAREGKPRESEPIAQAEAIIDAMPNKPVIKIDRIPKAYYSSQGDFVHMVERY